MVFSVLTGCRYATVVPPGSLQAENGVDSATLRATAQNSLRNITGSASAFSGD